VDLTAFPTSSRKKSSHFR